MGIVRGFILPWNLRVLGVFDYVEFAAYVFYEGEILSTFGALSGVFPGNGAAVRAYLAKVNVILHTVQGVSCEFSYA